MNMRWAWTLPVLSSLAVLLAAQSSLAQGYPPGGGPAGYGPQMAYSPMPGMSPYGQPGMMPGMPPGMMPGQPGQGPMPVGYGPTPDAYGTYGAASPDMMGGDMAMGGGCQYCGGMGCDMCSGGHGCGPHGLSNGLLGDCLGIVAPYADGGCAAVRWFDFAADFMFLSRDQEGADLILAAFGQNAVGGIALRTGDFDFSEEAGFRFTAQTQTGPGSNLEFTFFGLNYWQDELSAVRLGPLATDGLFSIFSDFGTNPFGGFAETDNADSVLAVYTSTFDSFELNFRQRWMAPNCRYQGSWMIGARHFKLDEEFNLNTVVSANQPPGLPAMAFATTNVNNALTGLQIGGDVWICILPGLRLGADIRAGVFGNRMNVDNIIAVNTQPAGPDNPFIEEQVQSDVAFVGDVNVLFTYRINYQWTARVGYQAVFVDGVALATSNFNTEPPAGPFGPLASSRVPFVNDDGHVFYHGFNAGLEFMW